MGDEPTGNTDTASRPWVTTDNHVHFCDATRLNELMKYAQARGLTRIGSISLPVPEWIHFNPEVLAAKVVLHGVDASGGPTTSSVAPTEHGFGARSDPPTSPLTIDAFGSFDNLDLLLDRPDRWNPAAQVNALYSLGFDGIKMWEGKPELQARLGVATDDPRLMEAYREAGRLGMPVLSHIADPPEFWTMRGGPWSYADRPEVPGFDMLIGQAESTCRGAPDTTFVFPHLLFLAGDLQRLGRFLEEHPNAYLDLAPGVYFYPELGGSEPAREDNPAAAGAGPKAARTAPDAAAAGANDRHPDRPEHSRAFFERYADRIVFGTDALYFPESMPGLPYRDVDANLATFDRLAGFLDSEQSFNNPFALTRDRIPHVRGLDLPDAVLRRIGGANWEAIMGRREVEPPSLGEQGHIAPGADHQGHIPPGTDQQARRNPSAAPSFKPAGMRPSEAGAAPSSKPAGMKPPQAGAEALQELVDHMRSRLSETTEVTGDPQGPLVQIRFMALKAVADAAAGAGGAQNGTNRHDGDPDAAANPGRGASAGAERNRGADGTGRYSERNRGAPHE